MNDTIAVPLKGLLDVVVAIFQHLQVEAGGGMPVVVGLVVIGLVIVGGEPFLRLVDQLHALFGMADRVVPSRKGGLGKGPPSLPPLFWRILIFDRTRRYPTLPI